MSHLNPFRYSGPVGSRDLIGRDLETEQLQRTAEEGNNSRLVAPRRYGKTSLLGRVLEDADMRGYRHVYVDFLGVSTAQEAARRIEEAYRKSLNSALRRLVARIARSWNLRAASVSPRSSDCCAREVRAWAAVTR